MRGKTEDAVVIFLDWAPLSIKNGEQTLAVGVQGPESRD